jgi:hypothetical protein
MVIPAPDSNPLEVRNADGEVIAYLVPAEQMARQRVELASLREQLAIAVQQRDHHLTKLREVLKTYFPLLPTPEEMNSPQATSEDIARLVADLESR